MFNTRLKSLSSISNSDMAFEIISDNEAYNIIGGEDRDEAKTEQELSELRQYFGLGNEETEES